ncbi:glycoside hydrolase family 9 protein [Massilia sp. CCM 9210]|uniref:glycoside hydrolase family 9 protein n=1 Tax=Massilia scottii TaxID=3057166 RepID=UPI002796A681|nr:glycoside hydrolase family 9 protein [Massilia sp. CCM 9210]MDQ1815948.1 glycoside hydrolase family 9 protein [Massilia sp. CCM 9210]
MNTFTLSIAAGIGASVLGASFAHAATAIVSVHAAAPQVIVVEVQTAATNEAGGTATKPDLLDLTLSKWLVNSRVALGISRMSTPYDEQKALTNASPNLFPVTVRHKIYLRLDNPLVQGQPYTIITPYGATRLAFDNRATWCESIKVNQTGYSKLASSRFANFGAYLGDAGSLKLPAGSRYEVIDQRSGRVVLGGEARYIKDDTAIAGASSGEHVYRLRLDQLAEGGPYFVSVPGCGRSRSFAVGDDASRKIAYVSARGMYHQRCGTALKDRIVYFADRGGYIGPSPESQAYPQGAAKFLSWGATTTQGKYADVYAFASLFATDGVKKQAYINAVSQYADFSLGLNPLGRSFVTGLGTDTPQSPAHLDSYFTKYGLADGAGGDPHVKAIGNVPGIVVYGPTEGRSGAAYQTAVSNKLYPAWDKLPGLRRWGDGWSLINSNEFSTWETMVWNAAMHGFLYNASQDPEATSTPAECDGATCAETKPNACVIEPARFATPRAAPGTRVYGFSGINSYGACTTKVAQLSCEMP